MNYARLFGEECLIWPGHTAKAYTELDVRNGYFVEHSPRAGGSYSLAREAKHLLDELGAHPQDLYAGHRGGRCRPCRPRRVPG